MLVDVSRGKLHLKLEWLSVLSTPDKLDQVRYHSFTTPNRLIIHVSLCGWSLNILLLPKGADEHQSKSWAGQRRPVVCAARRLPGFSQKPAGESVWINIDHLALKYKDDGYELQIWDDVGVASVCCLSALWTSFLQPHVLHLEPFKFLLVSNTLNWFVSALNPVFTYSWWVGQF